jgi:hypothetical protein
MLHGRQVRQLPHPRSLYSDDDVTVRSSLAELGVPPGAALTREATLEDVFLRLTGRDLEE